MVLSGDRSTYGLVSQSATASSSSGSPVTVGVYTSDGNASESGPDNGEFRVWRSGGDTNQSLTVYYYTSGTATNGSDYQSLSGSVTFDPGSSEAVITVTPIDDQDVEGTEYLDLYLSSSSEYSLSGDYAWLSIEDNDFSGSSFGMMTVTPQSSDAATSGKAIADLEVRATDAMFADARHMQLAWWSTLEAQPSPRRPRFGWRAPRAAAV